jgi:GTPase SAR1 family protein
VSSEQSYANIQRWKAAFSNATQVEGVPFVLIGNKLDLGSRVNAQKVQTEWIDSGKAHDHV